MLTAGDVEQFKRDGYFIARGVFRDAELRRYRALARKLQEQTRRHLYPGTRFWFGGAQNRANIPPESLPLATWGVNEITRRELFEPELVDVFSHPEVDQAMHALLGAEPRAWGIKLLWTPKLVSYNLHWHRDQMKDKSLYDYAQFKPAEQDHVQFNAALNHDDCFIMVPGSHRRALTATEWHAVLHDRTAELPGQLRAELAPGDILYMDAHALHRGRCDTETDRLTLHYSAQAQWVPLHPWSDPADFAWITSEEFIGRLAPATRPYYQRLRSAQRADQPMSFLEQAARAHGWKPAPKPAAMQTTHAE
jgi:hypothetical protein